MRDKGFFTYARAHHGLERKSSTRRYEEELTNSYFAPHTYKNQSRDWRRQKLQDKALVFEPSFFSASIHEVAASIAGLPFMDGLFENGVMVTRYRLVTPSSQNEMHTMVASTALKVFPEKIGQLVGDLFFFWKKNGIVQRAHTTFDRLLSSCTSIERVVGHCEKCVQDYYACFTQRFDAWLAELPHDDKHAILRLLGQPSTIDQLSVDALHEFFEEFGSHKTWEFISPSKTGEAFEERFRDISDHQMWDLVSLAEERKERAQKAIKTKECLQICADECVLHRTCQFIESYKRGAKKCQEGQAYYNNRTGKGPYTAGMLSAANMRLLKRAESEWLPRKQIALIAANSGTEIRLLGPRMQMVCLQPDMTHVRFREVMRPYAEHTLSFEDAVYLCRLPYWLGGEYHDTGFREPHVEMSNEELLLYYEICQQDYIKAYNYYCGHCQPIIMEVDWRPNSKSFGVTGHAGWTCTIDSIRDVEPVLDTFPNVFKEIS